MRFTDLRSFMSALEKEGELLRVSEPVSPNQEITAIQHRVNVFSPANEMLALCGEHNLASINKSPLNGALLTGKIHENYEFEETDGRKDVDWKSERIQMRLAQVDALCDVLTSDGRTMAQGALASIPAVHSGLPMANVKELRCRSRGDAYCEWQMKPAE